MMHTPGRLRGDGGRWTTNIVLCIHRGFNRFGLIEHKLVKISDRVLGLRLKQLDEQGLVSKSHVEGEILYALTSDGQALVEVLGHIAQWQEERRTPRSTPKGKT